MNTTQHAQYRSRDRVASNDRRVAGIQAAFYVGTGVWPILHRRSFERVTGPKTDFWLARTVGLNVAAVGMGLAQAASRNRRVPRELRTVATACAVGLALVDVVCVARGRISKVYLADAAAELMLVGGWVLARDRPNQGFPPSPAGESRVPPC